MTHTCRPAVTLVLCGALLVTAGCARLEAEREVRAHAAQQDTRLIQWRHPALCDLGEAGRAQALELLGAGEVSSSARAYAVQTLRCTHAAALTRRPDLTVTSLMDTPADEALLDATLKAFEAEPDATARAAMVRLSEQLAYRTRHRLAAALLKQTKHPLPSALVLPRGVQRVPFGPVWALLNATQREALRKDWCDTVAGPLGEALTQPADGPLRLGYLQRVEALDALVANACGDRSIAPLLTYARTLDAPAQTAEASARQAGAAPTDALRAGADALARREEALADTYPPLRDLLDGMNAYGEESPKVAATVYAALLKAPLSCAATAQLRAAAARAPEVVHGQLGVTPPRAECVVLP